MGTLGLQVRNNLLRPSARVAKRIIDLTLCVLLSPFVLPLIGILYLLVACESGLPVFYSQERLGHLAGCFKIWKFRTMVPNASELLEQTLARNEQLRSEWAHNQKLRSDPRITAIGKLLRKTSLDELPQFWNVVRGEMSLVGPRPIVESEIDKYKDAYGIYTKTTPGVTGLWQVSGRNHTTYAERVAYDTFYVRNWSVWMDLYLLARTAKVIVTGAGAY
jgi:Undecaprenyl-phosphate galactose phosphotransferase WbaP